MATYAAPVIGAKRVSDITTADVLRVLTPIWTSKAETARRVKQRIGTVMQWAIAQGYRTDNPSAALTQALPKQSQKVQHRKSLHYDEIAACIETIKGSDAMLSTKLALEFLILTAARSGEVREATWDEIDLERQVWVIPADRMKAKTEHVVPLAGRAVEILAEAKQLGSAGFVFPGTKEAKPMSDMASIHILESAGAWR